LSNTGDESKNKGCHENGSSPDYYKEQGVQEVIKPFKYVSNFGFWLRLIKKAQGNQNDTRQHGSGQYPYCHSTDYQGNERGQHKNAEVFFIQVESLFEPLTEFDFSFIHFYPSLIFWLIKEHICSPRNSQPLSKTSLIFTDICFILKGFWINTLQPLTNRPFVWSLILYPLERRTLTSGFISCI